MTCCDYAIFGDVTGHLFIINFISVLRCFHFDSSSVIIFSPFLIRSWGNFLDYYMAFDFRISRSNYSYFSFLKVQGKKPLNHCLIKKIIDFTLKKVFHVGCRLRYGLNGLINLWDSWSFSKDPRGGGMLGFRASSPGVGPLPQSEQVSLYRANIDSCADFHFKKS